MCACLVGLLVSYDEAPEDLKKSDKLASIPPPLPQKGNLLDPTLGLSLSLKLSLIALLTELQFYVLVWFCL